MAQTTDPPSLLLDSPVRCPACDHAERKRLGPVRYGVNALVADQDASALVQALGPIELVRCAACGFCWTDPQYAMDAVLALYRQNLDTHWEAEGRDWSDYRSRLNRMLPQAGAALDVGCYTGGFLDQLGNGWERHGIEPIPYAARIARERGVRVHEGTLEEASYTPASFDLITLWDVAEHLQDPHAAFTRLAAWLRPGGILALETGNTGCRFARFMGADWWYVALLEHCSFYTAESFRRLFGRCGLQVVSSAPTAHHHMSRMKTATQLGKAALYRAVSLADRATARVARSGPASKLLRKHAPCVLGRDHLFVIARKTENSL